MQQMNSLSLSLNIFSCSIDVNGPFKIEDGLEDVVDQLHVIDVNGRVFIAGNHFLRELK